MNNLPILLSILTLVGVAAGQIKSPQPPPVKTPFAESLQAVVVTSMEWEATQGTARLFERTNPRAKWKSVGDQFAVVVGRSGMAWAIDSAPENITEFKKEGDGKAPAGMFPLTFVFGSATKPEQLEFPYTKIEQFTECVDDPKSTHYNKIVDRMKVGIFDWKSSEKMLEVGEEYGLGVFVAYNSFPVRSENGSCIFLHVWKDASTPTAGCTAMERLDLERLITWLDASKTPYLVQMPDGELKKFRNKWKLPKI